MMEQIQDVVNYIASIQIVDILIALSIIILFKALSSSFSYIIVKMFKLKTKNKALIKENAFYNPLRIFFTILGVYLGILFLVIIIILNFAKIARVKFNFFEFALVRIPIT